MEEQNNVVSKQSARRVSLAESKTKISSSLLLTETAELAVDEYCGAVVANKELSIVPFLLEDIQDEIGGDRRENRANSTVCYDSIHSKSSFQKDSITPKVGHGGDASKNLRDSGQLSHDKTNKSSSFGPIRRRFPRRRLSLSASMPVGGTLSRPSQCGEKHHSHSKTSSYKDPIVLKGGVGVQVGIHAQVYLKERFSTDVSTLDREKFHDVLQIDDLDIAKKGHLGSGGFSDVFEIVCESGKISHEKTSDTSSGGIQIQPVRRRFPRRRLSLSASITRAGTLSLSRPSQSGNKHESHHNIFAMKCLRPNVKSNPKQFVLGAEDQIRETAILANLDHAHIIKIYGRASGHLKDAFALHDDGYFIVVERLKETLNDRIDVWKRTQDILDGPTATQFEVAYSIADAITYLHSKDIVFRDLKPSNIGFDRLGVLKVFDFGSAMGLPNKDVSVSNSIRLLYDKCGTHRYMAPEVGLDLGYGLEADLYSFGILLWEICAWTKPFSSVNSPEEFERVVCAGGKRPVIKCSWPAIVKELIVDCWCAAPKKRPTMLDVKTALSLAIFNTPSKEGAPAKHLRLRRNRASSM